jgi:hypothetical protein
VETGRCVPSLLQAATRERRAPRTSTENNVSLILRLDYVEVPDLERAMMTGVVELVDWRCSTWSNHWA